MAKRTAAVKLRQFAGLGVAGGIAFSGMCLYKQDESFYRKTMNFLHFLDPEDAHRLSILVLANRLLPSCRLADSPDLQVKVFGRVFDNPVGLAAGFDKQGEAALGLQDIGFGFIEIGSITPLSQQGNPKPRVFRLSEDEAVINRYGFNSDGHEVVCERIKKLRANPKFKTVLGVNLGKNKTSIDAVKDYVDGVHKFGRLADYLVINVSSPNTPGLRSLQGKEELKSLISEVLKARDTSAPGVPLLIKIAPDLTSCDKEDIAAVVTQQNTRVDGLIISNTTVTRPALKSAAGNEAGGLSGAPLRDLSTQAIHDLYKLTRGALPIIGVGGVSSGEEAYQKIQAGASLVQIYSALVYQGPPVVSKIRRELSQLLKRDGLHHISEAVGSAHK